MEPVFIIADDHPLFRDAMSQAIVGFLPNCQLKLVGDLDSLRALLKEMGSADLVMLDLAMPGASGVSGIIQVRAEFPDTPIVVVSASEDPATVRRCLDLGVSGFIPKSSSSADIQAAIENVQFGEIWIPPNMDLDETVDAETRGLIEKLNSLTPQQMRVLAMLGEGLLNKQIAYELGVSEATIKAHVSAVLLKLEVDSRTQAVIIMNRINAGFPHSQSENV
ncbi:MAG: response regulator transcription factor [Rhizobiaceae bacterium]|nr:response regulator transcription factor [Rhizobiaceae bacterium]